MSSVVIGGLCGLLAEGIEVFLGIEENTRQATLIAAQTVATAPTKAELQQMAVHLVSATRLLEQMAINQQQTNQRLEALSAAFVEVRSGVSTGVQAIESIAESSKVTATVLYRQGVKPT